MLILLTIVGNGLDKVRPMLNDWVSVGSLWNLPAGLNGAVLSDFGTLRYTMISRHLPSPVLIKVK